MHSIEQSMDLLYTYISMCMCGKNCILWSLICGIILHKYISMYVSLLFIILYIFFFAFHSIHLIRCIFFYASVLCIFFMHLICHLHPSISFTASSSMHLIPSISCHAYQSIYALHIMHYINHIICITYLFMHLILAIAHNERQIDIQKFISDWSQSIKVFSCIMKLLARKNEHCCESYLNEYILCIVL